MNIYKKIIPDYEEFLQKLLKKYPYLNELSEIEYFKVIFYEYKILKDKYYYNIKEKEIPHDTQN